LEERKGAQGLTVRPLGLEQLSVKLLRKLLEMDLVTVEDKRETEYESECFLEYKYRYKMKTVSTIENEITLC
jgi:hypothetical protein